MGDVPLTLAAVPAEAPRHVRGLDGTLLAGLQQDEEPLELIGDAGDGLLLSLLEFPATHTSGTVKLEPASFVPWSTEQTQAAHSLVECVSELRSHEQGLQKAVQVTGHGLVHQAYITFMGRKKMNGF